MVSNQSTIVRYYFKNNQEFYGIPFPYQLTSELHVFLIDSDSNRIDLAENVDYTVTAQSIKLLSPSSLEGDYLIIQREGDIVQDTELNNGEFIDVKKIEEALDTMVMRLQEMELKIQNTLKNPYENWDSEASLMLPNIEKRKNAVLFFKEDGVTMDATPWEDVVEIHTDIKDQQKLARDWATKMDGPVQDGEYSSKYHAAQAKQSKEETETLKDQASEIKTAMEEFVKKYCWYADQAALRAQQYANACRSYKTSVEGLKNRMVELEAQTETYHDEVFTMHQAVIDAKTVVVNAEASCEEILIQMQEFINDFSSTYQQAIDGIAAQELQSLNNIVNETADLIAQVTNDKAIVAIDKNIVLQTKSNIETLKSDIEDLVSEAQAAASQSSAPTITVEKKVYTQSIIVKHGKRFLKTVEVVPEDSVTTGGEA